LVEGGCSIGLGRVEDQPTTAQRIFQAVASSTIAGLGEGEPIPGNSCSFEQTVAILQATMMI
jgi:hypothetical protein